VFVRGPILDDFVGKETTRDGSMGCPTAVLASWWESPLLRREFESLRPPPANVSYCLACIPAESGDSGRISNSDRLAICRLVKNGLARSVGSGLPES